MVKDRLDNVCQLRGEERRNGIADLVVLFRLISFKEVIVGKRLESRRLADGQRSALRCIIVNEVMTIL